MRYFRLVTGIVVIALAVWIILGEQMSGASADAVVNARLSTVRAPVAGAVQAAPRALGTTVRRGDVLATMNDPLVDGVRLDDLLMEQSLAEAEVARLEQELEATSDIRTHLEARAETFRTERLAEIETGLDHARIRLALLETSGAFGGAEADLAEVLDQDTDRTPGEPRLYEIALDHARERVEVLEIALRAARAGVFLGDGYNDAPNSEQRLAELQSVTASLNAELTNARSRLQAVADRVGRERLRVNRFGVAEMTAPVEGVIWEALTTSGETLQRGQDAFVLLDCTSVMVTLSVTENVYNRLSVGDSAVFRLSGSGQTFEGTINRLAGAGAATIYRNLAIAPSERHLERFDVLVSVPGLRGDPALACGVGRTGRVFFDRRPLDWLRNLWG